MSTPYVTAPGGVHLALLQSLPQFFIKVSSGPLTPCTNTYCALLMGKLNTGCQPTCCVVVANGCREKESGDCLSSVCLLSLLSHLVYG